MTVQELRNAYRAEPFTPFVLHLADGRAIPVISREFMTTAQGGRSVAVYQPDETMNVIDLLLVTDLAFKKNGKGKKKSSA
jgi:hypothetical protein